MSCKLKPAIWPRDTGQLMPCSDRCQLVVAWTSNIKKVNGKTKAMSLSTSFLEYGRHVARLCRRRRHRRAYAPTSNTASHEIHEKINSWVFSFLYEYGAPLGGPKPEHRYATTNGRNFPVSASKNFLTPTKGRTP